MLKEFKVVLSNTLILLRKKSSFFNYYFLGLSGPNGGIGRRAGLKHLWETVPVRLRLRVQKRYWKVALFSF